MFDQIVSLRMRFFGGDTDKSRRKVWEVTYEPFEFDIEIPDVLLMILIGTTYSVIAPLIVPFAVFYFMFAQVTNKNREKVTSATEKC